MKHINESIRKRKGVEPSGSSIPVYGNEIDFHMAISNSLRSQFIIYPADFFDTKVIEQALKDLKIDFKKYQLDSGYGIFICMGTDLKKFHTDIAVKCTIYETAFGYASSVTDWLKEHHIKNNNNLYNLSGTIHKVFSGKIKFETKTFW